MTKILIIEDQREMRENLGTILDMEGYTVVSADNGAAGVSLARSERPAVVLCDVMMPELDGYGVLRALRDDPATADTPFIFLTAKGEKRDQRTGMNLGADDYLTKPVSASDLLNAITARLARAALRPAVDMVTERSVVVPAGDDAVLFRQEGEYWTIGRPGEAFRLRDAKGLGYLASLLRHPGRDFHALELEGVDAPAGALGDAGELVDAQARREYKRRLTELAEELEEARRWSDVQRAARLEQEHDALTDELARAFGLGGRDRRAGSAAERSRLNVTRAIARVVRKIDTHSPVLGRHLDTCVKTGIFCCYAPDPERPVAWAL